MEKRKVNEFPLRTPGGMTYAMRVEQDGGPAIQIKHGKHTEVVSINTVIRQLTAASAEDAEKARWC